MKDYILQIVAAALVCAVVQSILGKKTVLGNIAGLLCGILMAVTVLTPLGNIAFDDINDFWADLSGEATKYVNEGVAAAEKDKSNIIKDQSEAYILDKANRMGLQITVEVELDESNGNIPCSVIIDGEVSPYAQTQLEDYLESTLGISKENQVWK